MNKAALAFAGAAAAVSLLTGCTGGSAEPQSTEPECAVEDSLHRKVALAFDDGVEVTGRYGIAEAVSETGWLVAVEYRDAGTGGTQTGVWFTQDTGAGQLFSVDGNAVAVSSWGLGEDDRQQQRRRDSGYGAALECLR